ncbi:MAG: hypothetical protein WAX80_02330 [Minisyncoccia bacterium]
MKYGDVTLGQVEAVWNRLGGESGVQRFLARELVVVEKDSLKPVVVSNPTEFPVWLEIEVGGKSKGELIAANKTAERETSTYAADIMGKDAWKSGQVEVVKFARVKVRELGFTKNPTTQEIWNRIEELGHSLCEPADGPALGVAFKDQPTGDVCWMAMKQIADSDGDPSVFGLERGGIGKRWLRTRWVLPYDEWNLGNGFVFRLRKLDLVPGVSA